MQTVRNNLKSLFAAKQNNLNRTVVGDDNATSAATDVGGNLSVPIPVTTAAPIASATQTTAGTRSLRAQIKILIDNIAQLFNALLTETTARGNNDITALSASGRTLTATRAAGNLSATVAVTKSDIGLGNVDNTSDVSKPVSTAQQTALDVKAPLNGALADAAASATLPSTVSESIWTKLQAVRNNLRALFSYFTNGVANNADKLDGQEGAYYQNAGNLNAGTLPVARLPAHTGDVTSSAGSAALTLTAAQVLAKLLTVDGTGSGLDADLLDGTHAYQLHSVASDGADHGVYHIFRIFHNYFGDGRFALVHSQSTGDASRGYESEVDYARNGIESYSLTGTTKYIKFVNNTLIQWGVVAATATNTQSVTIISYSNTNYTLLVSDISHDDYGTQSRSVKARRVSGSSFSVVMSTTYNNTATLYNPVHWLTIGVIT
jgi:hypothetical protein